MAVKIVCILLLLVALQSLCHAANSEIEEYKQAYYDRKTNKPSQGISEISGGQVQRISFKGGSCGCRNAACSCCIGINLKKFKFNQEGCAKINYNPQASAITASLTLNNKAVVSSNIPINTTPSICGTVPQLSSVKFCLRLSKLSVESNKLNACVDLETHVPLIPTLVLHFPCIKV
nr:PREDICTED: uncharacterized protein LOC100880374 [Megachile rotundata]